MASKQSVQFRCTNCGKITSGFLGRCPNCSEFNTIKREELAAAAPTKPVKRVSAVPTSAKPELVTEVNATKLPRIQIPGQSEFNHVLGGGLVPGSIILIGGDPGVGKSTLIAQSSAALSGEYSVLYVSGEESREQVKMRIDRLGLRTGNMYLYTESCVESIFEQIRAFNPEVVVIDLIQTMFTNTIDSTPGSTSQVRECTHLFQLLAKQEGVTIILIGHVTKDGQIAGPQVMSHLVDAVMYLEGDQTGMYRILRGTKNRFGAVNDIALYQMTGEGMVEVLNPSEALIAERNKGAWGSVITPIMEGTRPLLVEFQALAADSPGGYVSRSSTGYDLNRLKQIIAIMQVHLDLRMVDFDLFTNIIGGIRVTETSADLPMALAIWSSIKKQPIPPDVIVLGEIGLNGEVRVVNQSETRLREAFKLGFRTAIVPAATKGHFPSDMKVYRVSNLPAAVERVIGA